MKKRFMFWGMLAIVAAFGLVVVGCKPASSSSSPSSGGGGETEKTLIIQNIPEYVYSYGESAGGAIGIFSTGTTVQEALAMTGVVAGAYLDSVGIIITQSSGFRTITIPLYNLNNDTRWNGSGTYDIYVLLNGGGSHIYKVTSVNISSGTTTIPFNSAIEVDLSDGGDPTLTGTVSITGTAKVGETLTANTSGDAGTGSVYQWKQSSSSSGPFTAISGATASTYILTAAEENKYIVVTVSRNGYSGSITSDPTAAIAAAGVDTRVLAVESPTFETVIYGYTQPAAQAIIISNSGTGAATISNVALSGTGASAFELDGSGSTVSAGDSNTTRTVQPKAGLAAGTYTATITVTYNGTGTTTATTDVSITVNKAAGGTVTTPVGSPSGTSVTVTAVFVSGNTEQTPEYAISTSNTVTPETGWQTGTTFNGLSAGATYYVYARARESTNYLAGAAVHSTAIEADKLSQASFAFSAGTTASKTYGDANPTYTAIGGSGSGAISYAVTSGDAASVNASSGAVSIIKAGTAVITATKAGDATYNDATVTLTLTVNKLTLTATAQATDRVYDGTTAIVVNITPTNTVGGDAVTLTATGTADNANAGNAKAVTISGISEPSGAQATNYNKPASIPNTTVTINKLTLTATAEATDRTYNGSTTVAVTITPTNTVGSDVVTLIATGTIADADAGNGKPVTISGISEPSGAQAGNYNKPASIPNTTVNIAPLTGTAKVIYTWVNEHEIVTSANTATLSRGANDSLTIAVTGSGYSNYQWTYNGTDVTTAAGSAVSYTFDSAGRSNGKYYIGLRVQKDNAWYSTIITITVTD